LKKLFIALVFSVLLCGCNAAKQTTAAASCNNTTWNGTFSGVSQGGMQPLTLTINGDSFTGTLGGSPISGPVSYCAGEGTTNPCSPVGINSIVPGTNGIIDNFFEITINGVLYQSEDYIELNAAGVGSDPNLCVGEMSTFNLLPFDQPYSLDGWSLVNNLI
jgi:hypothetical protein